VLAHRLRACEGQCCCSSRPALPLLQRSQGVKLLPSGQERSACTRLRRGPTSPDEKRISSRVSRCSPPLTPCNMVGPTHASPSRVFLRFLRLARHQRSSSKPVTRAPHLPHRRENSRSSCSDSANAASHHVQVLVCSTHRQIIQDCPTTPICPYQAPSLHRILSWIW